MCEVEHRNKLCFKLSDCYSVHFGGKIQKNIFDITTIGNYIVAGVLARGNPLPHAKGQIISEKKYYLQFSQNGNEIFEGFLP